MIIDNVNKQIQMEARDINYILPPYIRQYLFYMKNEDHIEIIFPTFNSVPHPTKAGVRVTIRYVPELSEIAVSIARDGSSVKEIAPEAEAVLDAKDEEIKKLKEQLAVLSPRTGSDDTSTPPNPTPSISQAHTNAEITGQDLANLVRMPRQHEHLAPPGEPLDNMHQRSNTDLRMAKADMLDGPEIDEDKQKPFDKEEKRDDEGRPIVER